MNDDDRRGNELRGELLFTCGETEFPFAIPHAAIYDNQRDHILEDQIQQGISTRIIAVENKIEPLVTQQI